MINMTLTAKMMNLLDHYVLFYLKRVDLLHILIVTEKMSFLRFLIEDEEIIIKYKVGKKITKTYGFKLDSL